MTSIFDPISICTDGTNAITDLRNVKSYNDLEALVQHLRAAGRTIVITSGTWDLLHIGHARYLEAASKLADVLIVGVDSDNKVRERKGHHRPIVPEEERLELLTNLRSVSFVFLKSTDDERWQFIRTIKPDVLVISKRVYSDTELDALAEFCGRVELLPSQATTSTSAKIRLLLVQHFDEVKRRLLNLAEFIDEIAGE